MNILIVTPSYSPIIGGSETLTRTLSTQLNELGVHTDIMTFSMNRKWNPVWKERVEYDGGSMIFRVPAINPFPFLSVGPFYYPMRINVLPKLDFWKRFAEYDIIHFLGEADLSLPFFSRSISQPKIMHCVGIPSLDEQFRRHTTMRRFFTMIFRTFANLYVVFSRDEQIVLSNLGIPSDKVLVLPYGVDTTVFKPDDKKKQDRLILFVGRIHVAKGLHILLSSLRYIKSPAQVVIIGPASDRKYFETIMRMCLEANTSGLHTVNYIGEIDQKGLVPWYQKASVLARPDIVGASGAGCSTMEAMASGTPIVGVKDHILKDGVNGLIVPPNDPKKLAEALDRILTDQKLLKRCGNEARRLMEDQYDLRSVVTRLSKTYERMLLASPANS